MGKVLTQLLFAVLGFFLAEGLASAAYLTFNDAPTTSFSEYSCDVNGDGTADVLFSASDNNFDNSQIPWEDLTLVDIPALQGTIYTEQPEVMVRFLGGATGNIFFDFAVPEGNEYQEVYVQWYEGGTWRSGYGSAGGNPAESFFAISISYTISEMLIDFRPDSGTGFVLDNFRASIGAAQPSSVPLPGAVWFLGFGFFGLVAFKKRFMK